MLEDLKSRYIIFDSEACKKESPRAASTATLILSVHERGYALPGVGHNCMDK